MDSAREQSQEKESEHEQPAKPAKEAKDGGLHHLRKKMQHAGKELGHHAAHNLKKLEDHGKHLAGEAAGHGKALVKEAGQGIKDLAHDIKRTGQATRKQLQDLYDGNRLKEVLEVLADQKEKFRQVANKVATSWIPFLVKGSQKLAKAFFDLFLPPGTRRTAKIETAVSGKGTIPAYCVPVAVKGKGTVTLVASLARIESHGAPIVQIQVGIPEAKVDAGAGVGLAGPIEADVMGKIQIGAGMTAVLTTHLDQFDWTTGFVEGLRGGDYQGAFTTAFSNVGAVAKATQFGLKISAEAGVGAEGNAKVPYAGIEVGALVGMGMEIDLQSPSKGTDGHLTLGGELKGELDAKLGAELPLPAEVIPFVGALLSAIEASGAAEVKAGMRLGWTLHKLDDRQGGDKDKSKAISFDGLELYLGAGVKGSLLGTALGVEGEGGIKFTIESMKRTLAQLAQLGRGALDTPGAREALKQKGGLDIVRDLLPFHSFSLDLSAHADTTTFASFIMPLVGPQDVAGHAHDWLGGRVAGDVSLKFEFEKDKLFEALHEVHPLSALSAMARGQLSSAVKETGAAELLAFVTDSCEEGVAWVSKTSEASFKADAGVVDVEVKGGVTSSYQIPFATKKNKDALKALIRHVLDSGAATEKTDGKLQLPPVPAGDQGKLAAGGGR